MQIIIPAEISASLHKLCRHYENKEFTLIGKSRVEGENVYLVDFRVPHHESDSVNTEMTQEDQEKFYDELIAEKENPVEWNFWIHSHHTMGVFWSGTDKEQMSEFNTGAPDMFFHVVISAKDDEKVEYRGACSIYKPFEVIQDDVEVVVGEVFCSRSEEVAKTKEKKQLRKAAAKLRARMEAMIEPLMTIVLGAILGWVMLAVLGPVYDTISKMKF